MVLSKNEKGYIVIDEQQRLITTSLMLTAMRDLCFHFDVRAPHENEKNYGDEIEYKLSKEESTCLYSC